MSLYEALKNEGYLHPKYGTVSNDVRTDGSFPDNPSLFTAQAMLICESIGESFDISKFTEFLRDTKVQSAQSGLFKRFPGCDGDTSQDELLGMSTLDSFTAICILNYGDAHWWCFQPQGGKFIRSSWKGRFIWLRPYIKQCAGIPMNIFDQLRWAIPCWMSSFSEKGDTSGKLLNWVMVQEVRNRYRICDFFINRWVKKMTRMYESPKELFRIYFGDKHPFARFAPDKF